MAQAFDTLQQDTAVEIEKVGVILGFLVGLVLAIGLVTEPLTSAGLPTWISVGAVFLVVAVSTRAGLAASRLFSRD